MSKCLNLSDPTIRKMVNDFGEINVSKLLDAYYPDKTPTYEEFIANRKVKEALGFIPISKTKDEIGKSFPREISNNQLAKLKRLISNVNNRTKDFVYMIFNVERIGEADLFTWGLRKVKGSLDVAKKIDRAIGKFEKTIAKSDELALLKERLDLEKKVTPVYSKPVSLPKQELSDEEKSEQLRLEQEAMEYREEPPTIAKPEEPKAPIDKLIGDLKRPSYNKQKEYYLAKDVQSLLQEIVKFTEDVDTKLLAEALLKIPDINKIKLNVTKFNKETKDKGIITSYPDALGIYNSFENLIEVIGTLDKKTFETVFLHEVIHGITVNEFYSNKQFSDKINKLYNYALKFKDYRTSKGITLGEMYGMYNAKEFMSEAMTNPDFIYELSKYYSPIQEKLKEKNIFQEFINLVVDLIKNKLEGKGKKYIEDNLGKTVLNTISNYTKISSKGIYSISKFEEKQIKPGVEELFESNLELANAVYEALGFKGEKTIETAKGSTYRYLPSGKTQRFKKVEGKEYEPQDILTFVPNYEWIKSNNPQWLEKQGLENDTQYTQYLLEKVQGKGKVWIVDSKGKKIETNQDAKTADRLFIAFGKKDGTVEDFIPVSKEPVIGFYTYDSRIHFDEKGERYRDRHLGNKVVKITEGITPQQKQQALQLYSKYLDSLNKPNTNPILQGNQQEQVKKFAELQERLNNKEFVEGTKVSEGKLPHTKRIDQVNKTLLLDIKSGIEKGGIEDFNPKEEYHLTVIGFPIGKKIKEASQEVQDKVKELIDNTNFTISLKPEKYKIKKTYKTGERESIIQLASVPEINNFYKKLSDILGEELPKPFPHITLATKGDKMGIGVTSKADFETLSPVLMPTEKAPVVPKRAEPGEQGKLFFSRKQGEVQYMLKAISILTSDLGKKIFEKGQRSGWSLEKTLTELKIPKDQIKLITLSGKKDREEIVTDLLANYSYTVEINVAKEKLGDIWYSDFSGWGVELGDGRVKYFNTEEEANIYANNIENQQSSEYYSDLTVPGGTNYTENEIATPAITPTIKGHAQFATDQGIGWFRSDELDPKLFKTFITYAKKSDSEKIETIYFKNGKQVSKEDYDKTDLKQRDFKTRRILEIQSDYFQKLRNNFKFRGVPHNIIIPADNNGKKVYLINEEEVSANTYNKAFEDFIDQGGDNQFLALLHKGDNWVTFFVKSIIQDSAKKGYEKVLFPTGNTASKIEGHTTLEEYKKQKENRIKELEELKQRNIRINKGAVSPFLTPNSFENEQTRIDREITQLKQELERIEREGFGALKPIFKFYEENVANVLKKQGFSPKVITDEYGNTWNEIEITPQMAEDYILFSTKKTEVERILTEGEVELREIIKTPEKEIVQEKLKNPRVIEKMRAIINALGIKLEIATLPEEIAAQADILNRLIKFAEDSITEDNFTEETVHFIVEIIEQKDPKLYKMLESEIWKYEIYTSVKNEYSNFPEYRNSDGSLNVAKIKKEAIGQLLVAKLLENADIKDEKNFWGSVWETMSNFIKNLFYGVGYGQRDEFQNLVDSIMQNPELITSSDVAYLQGPGVFFSRKTKTGVPSSLARARKRFGTKREGEIKEFENEIEAFEYFKALNADIQTVTEKELNPLTNEYEDVDYYIYKGNKKARVTAIISEANKKTFNNISQDEIAKALREAKMQKGTAVHKTIQDILERYIDTDTGLLRDKPLDKPANINIPAEAYKRLENHLSKRLESYPTGTRFLIETKVVNEEQGYGGTIDFMAFLPTGETDILDWKTTDVTYWEAGERKKRFDISPFNQTYWRTQLSFYKRALESNGVSNFRYTRAIPIAMETRQTLVDKSKAATPDNVVYNITNLQVGSIEPKKIKKDEFYLVPVSLEEEKTGIQELDDLIKKLQGIYERIRTTQYKKEEAYKKRQELDRLNSAIREIQTKRTATLFTGLFTESFDRFKKLEKVQFDFLENIEDKKFLSKEQENQLHQYFNEIYSAVEFLDTFQSFPSVIDTLYKEEELSQYEKQVKIEARKIGVNSQKISTSLKNKSMDIMEKVGKLYNIDELLAEDNKNPGLFSGFTSILHREEKSIQFAARLINVIKFLGQKEVNDFFNEDTGKFTKIFSAVKEWGKQNKKSFKEIYSYFLAKDQNGNPLRQLIDKIRPEYRNELKTKKEEFETFKKGIEQTAADIGYTGENYDKWVAREYKEHVMSWLEKNYNLDVYDKNYKEALDKYKESIKNLRLDEDAEINKTKKQNLLKSWISDHDIYSSPNAISLKNNYLLYGEGVLKEDSWYSDEYKFLKQAGNEPLLEAYELFTSLNKRAQENGMLDDIFSARLFLPNVADPSLQKAAFVVLKDGSKGAWYSISKVWNFIKEYLGFLLPNDTEGFQQAYDPLTGKELRRIPVKYKYVDVPEIERKENETDEEFEERKKTVRKIAESELSSDLFEIYAKWADHIIKYEMLSNYENRFKMIQLVESLKDDVLAVDSKGNIIKQKELNTQMYKSEYQLTPKDPKVLSELNQIINNYVYSTNLDVKPEFYKIGNLLYDYASLKLLGLNITSWISNIVGATYSARFNEGKAYKKNDFVNIGVNAALGVFNENMSQYGSDLFTKSRYLINTLDTRIQSEYDRDVSRKFKTEGIYELGEIAFAGFRLGDHFIQDAIATSIFLNTTVKDGKLININDFVKAKYNAKIYDTTISSAERKELLNQRDEEIEQMKREENLFRFVKEQNGKFSIEGIDFNTEEGMAEMLRYQNLVAHYIKQAIGNVDEFDKSINRMSWGWKFIMQFKNWMPRVIGSRFQELEYQYELDDYHYGRSKIFMDSFANNLKVTLKEVMRSLIEVIPFVDRKTGSVDLIKAAKDAYIRKRNEAIRKNKPFDLTEAEFVDIYVTGFRNQMSEFRNVIYLSMAIAMIAMAAEGEEDKWYWKLIYKTLFKVKREAEFVYDPEQVVTFFSAGVAPILTVVIDLFNIVGEFKKEILEPEKGKPIATVIESIPIARELHYWLSAMSEEYADMLGIEQPRVEKNL